MDFLEAKQALARKLDIDYADIANNGLFTEADLEDYLNQGAIKAWDYKFWDFTEHSKTATLTALNASNGYISHPNDIAPSSIYYLTVDGVPFDKKSFPSFQRWFTENASDDSPYWTEFKRLIFLNKNKITTGTVVDIFGKRSFQKMTEDTDLMPFSMNTSDDQYSGNQACILLAYAEALSSDKKKNTSQAEIESKNAYNILESLSKQLEAGRASEQIKNRPMFNVPDMFPRNGRTGGSIGKFSI